MSSDHITFVFGDRATRPHKAARTIEHIIRDVLTAQGFIGLGIFLQTLCAVLIPPPYALLPGAIFIAIVSLPTVCSILGLKAEREETSVIVGKTAAYLDFAEHRHVGKRPGASAVTDADSPKRQPPQLALMLIGSQCHSRLGALQSEFKEMGEVFADMIKELRTASPEEDVGFLNAEFYMHAANSSNNSNMGCFYFKSYAHILRFAHVEGGSHWPAWNKFRKLQRERHELGEKLGIWHEIYEISNAEAIYHNMPRFGLGDMWDPVAAPGGGFVYRNSLVMANGGYATSEGRMGHSKEEEKRGGRGSCPMGTMPT